LDLEQVVSDPFGAFGPAGTTVIELDESDDWERWTPELTLSFAPDRYTYYWGKLSRGFKSGGFNTAAAQPGFGPEDLHAWEVGVKKRWPALDLYADVALFHYDYRDMQLRTPPANAPVGTFPSVINAARATVRGVDFSARYRPGRGLGVGLGVSLLDARFDDFVSRDPNRPTLDPDHAGERLPQAPEVSLNISMDYVWMHLGFGRFTASAGYRYQSDVFYGLYEDPATKQDGYGLIDAALGWQTQRGDWTVQLFGSNLADEGYWKGIVRQDPLVGTLRNPGAPRTVGLRVRFDY
jgi:iron complex outermembrane receptor protein